MTMAEESSIWRYMDLPRFVSMLSTSTLWFARAATFADDPCEGFCNATWYTVPVGDASPKCGVLQKPDGTRSNVSAREMWEGFSRYPAVIFENARDHLFVNSWCLSEMESMAMWQIYGASGLGVAIKSSVERYTKAAKFQVDSTHYILGRVCYHDELESESDLNLDFRESIPVPGQV